MPLLAALSYALSTVAEPAVSPPETALRYSVFRRVAASLFRVVRLTVWRDHFSAALMFGKGLSLSQASGQRREVYQPLDGVSSAAPGPGPALEAPCVRMRMTPVAMIHTAEGKAPSRPGPVPVGAIILLGSE